MRVVSIVSIFFWFGVHAQNLSDFVSLQSGGSIPEDFTTLSTHKFEADHAENTNKDLDKDFFLSTRFFIDELLLSGRVLFNDPVTVYLNKVADYVLKDQPELRKQLRFYILKTNIPNAFSTDQGVILFTTGLISQLENEAQLAYIICHEVIHFTEKHVRNEYVEQKMIEKGKGQYSRLNTRSRIAEMSKYSKDLEFEADAKGIEIYLESEYDVQEIFSEFEVLLYSYLPFDDIKFDTTYLNTEYLQIPGYLYPDTINEISQEGDYDDDESTHPNIEKRIDAAFEKLGDQKSQGNKKFVISEEEFYHVRNLCRFEGVNISLSEREYGNALYSVYLLQRQFTDNRFLDLAFIKSLYGLVKYKNNSRYLEVTPKIKKVEGESYILHMMLKNITKEQLNVVAFRHAYDMAEKYPDDKMFRLYMEDLKKELALNSGISANDFKSVSFAEMQDKTGDDTLNFNIDDSIAKVESSDLSKYEKIRIKKELKALQEMKITGGTDQEFHLYALADLVKNENLVEEIREIRKIEEEKQDSIHKAELEKNKSLNLIDKSEHLGIDKLVVVDPIYENYGLNEERNHLKTEEKKLGLSEVYMEEYPGLDVDVQLIDSKNLNSSDVHEFNDMGVLMQWVSEVVEHDEIEMISSCHDQMQVIEEKYGTSHFLFSGFYGYKQRTEPRPVHLYGLLLVYTAPIALADLMIIHNYFDLVAFSVNSDSDSVEFIDVQTINLKGIDRIMKAYVYDILYRLSSEPKTKK